jgi:hypothetical protein
MKAYPIKTSDTAYRLISDGAILVNFHNSYFYNLNPVGTFIWERCDGRHTPDEIAAELVDEFEVTLEEVVKDCLEFLHSLEENGLLQWSDSMAKS